MADWATLASVIVTVLCLLALVVASAALAAMEKLSRFVDGE